MEQTQKHRKAPKSVGRCPSCQKEQSVSVVGAAGSNTGLGASTLKVLKFLVKMRQFSLPRAFKPQTCHEPRSMQ